MIHERLASNTEKKSKYSLVFEHYNKHYSEHRYSLDLLRLHHRKSKLIHFHACAQHLIQSICDSATRTAHTVDKNLQNLVIAIDSLKREKAGMLCVKHFKEYMNTLIEAEKLILYINEQRAQLKQISVQ